MILFTLCIVIVFSLVIHIDTIDMGLYILYFKESQVEVSE